MQRRVQPFLKIIKFHNDSSTTDKERKSLDFQESTGRKYFKGSFGFHGGSDEADRQQGGKLAHKHATSTQNNTTGYHFGK